MLVNKPLFGKELFAMLSAFSIVVGLYKFTFFPLLNISYIVFLISIVGYIIKINVKRKSINLSPLIFALTLTVLSVTAIVIQPTIQLNYSRIILYNGKLLLWALVLSLLITENFDQQTFKKLVLYIAVIATVYLILQLLFFIFFGINLPNRLLFGLFQFTSEEGLSPLAVYRPYSFFVEPAYYGTYIVCVLAFILFDEIRLNNRKFSICLFLSIGAVMSTSTSAIIMLGVLYFLYFLKILETIGRRGIKFSRIVFVLFLILLIIYLLIAYESILLSLGDFGRSILRSINKLQRLDQSARVGASFDYLEGLEGLPLLLGSGIGNEYSFLGIPESYMNSVTRLVLNSGYIGLAIFLIYLIYLGLKFKDYLSWFFLILYASKCYSGNAMFSLAGIFMLTFLYLRHINLSLGKEL